MARPIPKKRQKNFVDGRLLRDLPSPFPKKPTLIVGIDLSMLSLAMAGVWYDPTLEKIKGPKFKIWRWPTGTHYFDRIADSANTDDFIFDLMNELVAFAQRENMYIAIEEPWPFGIVGKAQSQTLKQQAELQGALLGGLLKYGVRNIYQIPANSWRKIVADDLGITIHHTKYRSEELAKKYNCNFKESGKFRSKQWAMEFWKVPDWPDIISTAKGKVPRPEGSRAKAVQPDDRYDGLAIMEWMRQEWLRGIA